MKGKRITLKQWNELSVDTRFRAISLIMGYQARRWMAEEKMSKDDTFWEIIGPSVKVPTVDCGYKLIINDKTLIN